MSPILHSPDELIGTYQYDTDFFSQVEDAVKDKILAYDPDYGPYLWAHLMRTSSDLELFMIQEGYRLEDAHAVGQAFLLHDADKTLQDIELWRVEKEKRKLTDEQKKERPNHVMMDSAVVTGIVRTLNPELTQDQEKHLMVVRYLTKFHHERVNGTGPHAMIVGQEDNILKMATIVDAVDGKKKSKDLTTIFSDLNGTRHEGEFDLTLVDAYRRLLDNRSAFGRDLAPELANG